MRKAEGGLLTAAVRFLGPSPLLRPLTKRGDRVLFIPPPALHFQKPLDLMRGREESQQIRLWTTKTQQTGSGDTVSHKVEKKQPSKTLKSLT